MILTSRRAREDRTIFTRRSLRPDKKLKQFESFLKIMNISLVRYLREREECWLHCGDSPPFLSPSRQSFSYLTRQFGQSIPLRNLRYSMDHTQIAALCLPPYTMVSSMCVCVCEFLSVIIRKLSVFSLSGPLLRPNLNLYI